MRGRRASLGGLALVVVGGCFWAPPGRPTGLVERLKPFAGPRGADAVMFDVVQLEQPVGDRYLNHGLWTAADEQAIDLERKAVIEDNGFRVGLLGGILPSEFQTLLASERSNPVPRRGWTRAGTPKLLALGDAYPQLRFRLQTNGETTPVDLAQAQCVLQVTPSLTPDGDLKLAFLPLVQQGAKALWPPPIDGGLPLADQRPAERYPALGWEVTLAGSAYVVVGTRFEKADTLGHCCFVRTDGGKPVQRLLAIRASRLVPPEAVPEGSDAGHRPAVPPLARQAITTTVRGARE
jgi:hypothetical protein